MLGDWTRIFHIGAAETHFGDVIAATVEQPAFLAEFSLLFALEVTFFDSWRCFLFFERAAVTESLLPRNCVREVEAEAEAAAAAAAEADRDETTSAAAATGGTAAVLTVFTAAVSVAAGKAVGVRRRGRGSDRGERSLFCSLE